MSQRRLRALLGSSYVGTAELATAVQEGMRDGDEMLLWAAFNRGKSLFRGNRTFAVSTGVPLLRHLVVSAESRGEIWNPLLDEADRTGCWASAVHELRAQPGAKPVDLPTVQEWVLQWDVAGVVARLDLTALRGLAEFESPTLHRVVARHARELDGALVERLLTSADSLDGLLQNPAFAPWRGPVLEALVGGPAGPRAANLRRWHDTYGKWRGDEAKGGEPVGGARSVIAVAEREGLPEGVRAIVLGRLAAPPGSPGRPEGNERDLLALALAVDPGLPPDALPALVAAAPPAGRAALRLLARSDLAADQRVAIIQRMPKEMIIERAPSSEILELVVHHRYLDSSAACAAVAHPLATAAVWEAVRERHWGSSLVREALAARAEARAMPKIREALRRSRATPILLSLMEDSRADEFLDLFRTLSENDPISALRRLDAKGLPEGVQLPRALLLPLLRAPAGSDPAAQRRRSESVMRWLARSGGETTAETPPPRRRRR